MTMVVQHLENRLALSSENTNGELHEFQIVHALITQCKKPVLSDAEHSKSGSSCGSEDHSPKSNSLKRKSDIECKEERSSFVTTIRQTFNALAQATNPALCAKQHPNTIASTVKNIISQFSRQTYHGTLCLASPPDDTPAAKRNPSQRILTAREKHPSGKVLSSDKVVARPGPTSLEKNGSSLPSTSGCPATLESAPVKAAVTRQFNANPVATKPKTRSVRARNAHRLIRHESAPIPPPPGEARAAVAKTASVRRSKSDAVCYTSYVKQNQRKIESNVQTKVLHFENCCKGKGQASMCVECRKRSLEEEIASSTQTGNSVPPILPKIDFARPKQEHCMGALSYHKPSIISQNTAASTTSCTSSIASLPDVFFPPTKSPGGKHYPSSAKRPKAVVCPGGTFFLTTNDSREASSSAIGENSPILTPELAPEPGENAANVATVENSDAEQQCSPVKTKQPEFDAAPMQNIVQQQHVDVRNRTNADAAVAPEMLGAASMPPAILEDSNQHHTLPIVVSSADETVAETVLAPKETENLYTLLCGSENSGKTMEENTSGCSADGMNSKVTDDELAVTSNYDSSDNLDNSSCSSSSGESCSSPRQEYLDRRSRKLASLRRAPSTRYQKMRRKLKKLITRSRPSPEVSSPVVPKSQSDLEREFIESIRIPIPSYMLSKDSSFSAMRQQLAMHFDKNQDWMSRLPDHVVLQIFSYLDTRSLAMLKCVCQDFQFLIDSYDARGIDSLWVRDKRYIEDPCRFCRKKFTPGDVSMCRYHAKSYHCDLPYGRSYWMCCFQIERSAPGCRTGIHDNHWGPSPYPNNS